MVGRAAQDVMSLDQYTYIYHYNQRNLLNPHTERETFINIIIETTLWHIYTTYWKWLFKLESNTNFIPERNEHWRTFIAIGLNGVRATSTSTPSCKRYFSQIENCYFGNILAWFYGGDWKTYNPSPRGPHGHMNLNNELGLVFRTIDPLAPLVKENEQIPKSPKSIPNKTMITLW